VDFCFRSMLFRLYTRSFAFVVLLMPRWFFSLHPLLLSQCRLTMHSRIFTSAIRPAFARASTFSLTGPAARCVERRGTICPNISMWCRHISPLPPFRFRVFNPSMGSVVRQQSSTRPPVEYSSRKNFKQVRMRICVDRTRFC
jgi:hypothetical protein